MKKDRENNVIPTKAICIKNGKEIIADTTDGLFNELLEEKGTKKRIFVTNSRDNPAYKEEHIVTQEINEMIVYKGIIFYKSSATSSNEETKRLNTWLPSLGLDNQSSHGIGRSGPCFKITKLDAFYDKRFSKPDERIKKYEQYLGNDLMLRLNIFEIMLMSAEIGGGFWSTEDGNKLIRCLIEEGFIVEKGIVNINSQPDHTFEIPYEVKPEDNKYIAEKTKLFNDFFKEQGGCLHEGLCTDSEMKASQRDIYTELCSLAKNSREQLQNQSFLCAIL